MSAAASSPVYAQAIETYASLGVDAEAALKTLATVPISIHCWQGDDVGGFEYKGATLSGGGIQATGNYPGKSRSLAELRGDLDVALSLIPGKHRLNLHAIYGDFGDKKVERNAITPEHFASWIQWAKQHGMGLDFNPTCFSHPLAADNYTLSHRDPSIRRFWVEHSIACRKIGAAMGQALGKRTVTNIWIPDGSKESPADRAAPRERLEQSLDEIFKTSVDENYNRDALESKLFGIGAESYTVGSHEFYMGYAVKHQKMLCLDMGHFHPTESVADKISAMLQFVPDILLHVSRGVRWDSDHVVLFDDPTRALFEELVRGKYLPRTAVGLDYFDASINRVAAWVIGTRSTLKCLLAALLEPTAKLRELENAGDPTAKLALTEELKTLPFGAIWEEYCKRQNVPGDRAWIGTVQKYEKDVLSQRKG